MHGGARMSDVAEIVDGSLSSFVLIAFAWWLRGNRIPRPCHHSGSHDSAEPSSCSARTLSPTTSQAHLESVKMQRGARLDPNRPDDPCNGYSELEKRFKR